MKTIMYLSVILALALTACQNNSEEKKISETTGAIEKKVYDYSFVVDHASYLKANDRAYIECDSLNKLAYIECDSLNKLAYIECESLQKEVYLWHQKKLLIIESYFQKEDQALYAIYVREVKSSDYQHREMMALAERYPKSSTMDAFYAEFLKLEEERDSAYYENEDYKVLAYENNQEDRDVIYEYNNEIKQERYEAILVRYNKVSSRK